MTVNNQNIDPKEYEESRSAEPSLTGEITRKMSQLQKVGRDISAFINGFQLNVDRDSGAVQINLRKKTRPLVELIPLLKYCEEINPLEAIMGWNKTQEPMLWSASPSYKNHLLISGAPQAGKTGLLRSLILTLVLATRPSQLQLAIIDGSCRGGNNYDHSGLKKFSHLPHLLNRPPANPEEVCEIVSFLAKEADHRLKHQITTPQILLVIDNLQDILPVAGPAFHQQLEHILDIGPQTGIRVILATNRPEDGRLQDLLAGIETDRITGKMQSAGQAAFASGREDSDAECLDGNGEFLAELSGKNFHFQAAWVSEKHLQRYLQYINESKQPALLAWSIPADDLFYNETDAASGQENSVESFQYGFLEPDPSTESEPQENIRDKNAASLKAKNLAWEFEEDSKESIEDPIEEEPPSYFDSHDDDFEDEEIQDIPIEYAAEKAVSTDHAEDFSLEEDDDFENDDDHLAEEGESSEPNAERLTQLANIYTKLTGFWTEEPLEGLAEDTKLTEEQDQTTNQFFAPYRHEVEENLDGDLEGEDDDWEEDEQIEDGLDLSYEQPATTPSDQPRLILHEPEPKYKPASNGWLEFAADSAESSEAEESPDPGQEESVIEDDDGLLEDDAFSFTAENIAKPGRRSRLSHAKPKFKAQEPKPIDQKFESTNKSADTNESNINSFDPWQNGLDDEIESEDDHEETKPTAIVRPPRLVAKKPPTLRRRVSHVSNHFKPKPKPKATPAPEKLTEENLDGEIE